MATATAKQKRDVSGNGAARVVLEPSGLVPRRSRKREATGLLQPTADVPSLSRELQVLQRNRAIYLKSRNMIANRLQAIVAGAQGYHAGMTDAERKKAFKEAGEFIKAVAKGEVETPMRKLILVHLGSIDGLNAAKEDCERAMVKLAEQLPVAAWVDHPDRRGFGLLFLAIVVGETGDLANYANPAKVWRRMGCAPWSFEGQTRMGATWKGGKEGKLPKEEWGKFGYSPRRRSIAFLIGEGIVKQNGEGPYRARYDEAKAKVKEGHPDYSDLRCHRHGMLLATKRLLLELWVKWNRVGDTPVETDDACAGL